MASLPPPRLPEVLAAWSADPAVLVPVAAAAAAFTGAAARIRRRRGRGPARRRTAAFLAGLATILLADLSPLGRYAEVLFSVHMAQHLLLVLVAAPLLVAAAPLRCVLAAWPEAARWAARAARRPAARAALHPAVGWAALPAALYATHFTGLYDAALRRPAVHAAEHLVYLVAAVLFWRPVIGSEPTPVRLGFPARLAYLFLAMPVHAALGATLATASRVLYPAYEVGRAWGPSPLADQRAGGAVMWVGGGLGMLTFFLGVAAAWARHDRALAAAVEVRPPALTVGREPNRPGT